MDEEEDFDIELEGLEEDSTRVSHKRKREDSGSEAESEDVELAVVQKLCGHCHVDLAASIHFKCAICKHTLLCVDCFSCGVEFARHQNNHDYQVIDLVTQPIFDSEWAADEELLLIEGLLEKGMGNWKDVSDFVMTKSAVKCEAHYAAVYLNSPTAPLPDMSGNLLNPSIYPKEATNYASYPAQNAPLVQKSKGKLLPFVDSVVYRPKREEFDHDWDDNAEDALINLEFLETDTSLQRQAKHAMVRIYNRKLERRYEQRKFIFDRNLLYEREAKKTGAWGIPGELEILAMLLRPMVRFSTNDEHWKGLNSLHKEVTCINQLKSLKEYRINGVRTVEDEKLYLVETGQKNTPSILGETSPLSIKLDPDGFDLSRFDSAELMSREEIELCSELLLIPQQYLFIKYVYLIEGYSNSFLSREHALNLLPLKSYDAAKIYDFFVAMTWVNPNPIIASAVPENPPKSKAPGKSTKAKKAQKANAK